MSEQFLRLEMMIGEEGLARLSAAHVAVFGLGGVGSWAAEALARSGVGTLTLIDHDTIGVTNLNRQACALHSTLGRPKAEVMAERILDINPDCTVFPIVSRYDAEHRNNFFVHSYDYILDAIDLVSCKLDLIETSIAREIPILSALGTGNKMDPSLLRITDISKTNGCPLARVMRKELRRRGISHHTVLFSPEEALESRQCESPPPGRRSIPGSGIWVPACAGMMMAGHIISSLSGFSYSPKVNE